MPIGVIISKWTEDEGLLPDVNHPVSCEISIDDLMRIFYSHITGSAEAGTAIVRLRDTQASVFSYFTGMEAEFPLMISLVLELGEAPEMFGIPLLQRIIEEIIQLYRQAILLKEPEINPKDLETYIANALELLTRLSNLTRDQIMAQIYGSEKGRAIISILREMPRPRKQLRYMVEQKVGKELSDLDSILDLMVKSGVIQQDWIEGETDVYYFLVKDFVILRTPVPALLKEAEKEHLSKKLNLVYLTQVDTYFSTYEATEGDQLALAEILINPEKFDIVEKLKQAPIKEAALYDEVRSGLFQVKDIVNQLIELKCLIRMEDEDEESWLLLLCQPHVVHFYPEYLLQQVQQIQQANECPAPVLLKQLQLLQEQYTKED